MKTAIIVVPMLFLLALIYLAYVLYISTEAHTPCVGEACAQLNTDELLDRATEAQ